MRTKHRAEGAGAAKKRSRPVVSDDEEDEEEDGNDDGEELGGRDTSGGNTTDGNVKKGGSLLSRKALSEGGGEDTSRRGDWDTSPAPGGGRNSFKDMYWVVRNRIVTAKPPARAGNDEDHRGHPAINTEEGGENSIGRNDGADQRGSGKDDGLTHFRLDERELFENLLYQLRRDCPRMCAGGPEELMRAIVGTVVPPRG